MNTLYDDSTQSSVHSAIDADVSPKNFTRNGIVEHKSKNRKMEETKLGLSRTFSSVERDLVSDVGGSDIRWLNDGDGSDEELEERRSRDPNSEGDSECVRGPVVSVRVVAGDCGRVEGRTNPRNQVPESLYVKDEKSNGASFLHELEVVVCENRPTMAAETKKHTVFNSRSEPNSLR
jgi:hypothetical protein